MLIALYSLVATCGHKGPLYLPEQSPYLVNHLYILVLDDVSAANDL